MKNKTSYEIRAFIKSHIGLNVSVSQIYNELCQIHRTSVVSKRSDLSPSDFLYRKPFLVVIMNPKVHFVVQFTSVFRVYLKRPTSLPLQNGFQDLKSMFPSWENTLKG